MTTIDIDLGKITVLSMVEVQQYLRKNLKEWEKLDPLQEMYHFHTDVFYLRHHGYTFYTQVEKSGKGNTYLRLNQKDASLAAIISLKFGNFDDGWK